MSAIFVLRRLHAEKISESTKEFIPGRSHLHAGMITAKNDFQIHQIESSTREAIKTTNINARAVISFVSHHKQLHNTTRRHMEQSFQRNRHLISFNLLKTPLSRQSPHKKFTRLQLHRNFIRPNKPSFRQRMLFFIQR